MNEKSIETCEKLHERWLNLVLPIAIVFDILSVLAVFMLAS